MAKMALEAIVSLPKSLAAEVAGSEVTAVIVQSDAVSLGSDTQNVQAGMGAFLNGHVASDLGVPTSSVSVTNLAVLHPPSPPPMYPPLPSHPPSPPAVERYSACFLHLHFEK